MEYIISKKKYGNILIKSEEIFNYVNKNLPLLMNDEIDIGNMELIEVEGKQIFQILIWNDQKQPILQDKIEHLKQILDILFRSYLGINIEAISIGIRNKNGWIK